LPKRIGTMWELISLRAKLTTLSVAIIGVLLVVSSLGTTALLKTYLQQSQDTLLTSTATTLASEDPAQLEERLATRQVQLPRLPSDYYIAYLDSKGSLLIGLVSSTRNNQDIPNLAGFSSAYVVASQGQPFETVSSQGHSTKSWRMVAVPLTSMDGSLVVALPTASNDALLNQYRGIGTSFGLVLLILSALAIWITITQALRALREVERTAEAVAAGDISQRLIERPGKTEVARINRALNTMLNSIEGAMSSRNKTLEQMRRFVSDASHELRTPLVSVRGYAELYRHGALKKKADVDEAMAHIEAEAIRMSDLVESLLALARLDENAKPNFQTVELVEIARMAAKDASVADGNREIALTSIDGKPLPAAAHILVDGDAGQLRQVLTNLLANACRFSPAGAAIEVALGQTTENGIVGGKTVIEVRDHGEGIPKELRAKVFERFYRADNSRNRETGGSGLGLAIVSTIVKHHNGSIEALETPGGGATMRVTL